MEPAYQASAAPGPSEAGEAGDIGAPRRAGKLRDLVESLVQDEDLATSAAFTAEPSPALLASDTPAPPVVRRLRRRRSASTLPPLLHPAEVPEDAAGRVEFVTLEDVEHRASGAVRWPAPVIRDEPAPQVSGVVQPAAPAWIAVAALGALMVLLFVVGMLATR